MIGNFNQGSESASADCRAELAHRYTTAVISHPIETQTEVLKVGHKFADADKAPQRHGRKLLYRIAFPPPALCTLSENCVRFQNVSENMLQYRIEDES